MSNINLTIQFQMPTGAVSNQVSYARVDNLNGAAPTFINVVPNPVVSPATIATNIPNGQYQINTIPIYPDGRTCAPTIFTTPPCAPLVSISAFINGGVIVINYTAPSGVPQVRISIGYPNGGTDVANYVNDGNPISRAIPANLFGDYTVSGQSICDPVSGFYSVPSQTVTVTLQQPVPNFYSLSNDATNICNVTPQQLYTSGGFAVPTTLFTDSTLSTPVLGYNFVAINNLVYNLDPTTGVVGTATGQTCSATVTGVTSFVPAFPTSSGLITAPPGSTVNCSIYANGPLGSSYTLEIFIPALSISQVAANGTTTFSFTMPSTGSVAWNGIYNTSNSSGSGSFTVS